MKRTLKAGDELVVYKEDMEAGGKLVWGRSEAC